MRRRLVIVFLVPLVAILVALGGAAGWSAARSVQQAFYTQQLGDLGYFVTSARQALRSGSAAVIEAEAARFREVYGIEVTVFDLGGSIWAAGDDSPGVLAEEDAERVRLALSGRRAEQPAAVYPWTVADAALAEPVFDDGDVIGAVLVAGDADAPRAAILQQLLLISAIALVLIALGVLLVFRLARWVLSPVGRLDEAMAAIERGEMDARVAEDAGPPELRRMARVFNGMADQIERVMTRQQEFALNASHELRNPLNALLLRVEHLATGLGREWDDDVEETREEGRRMTRILETLLGLARGGRTDSTISAVDLATLAARRLDAWRDVAGQRGISLQTSGESSVMSVTDRTIVESALDAVIDNAVKYSPEGSGIEIGAERSGDVCRVTVRDHGPGLTPEQAAAATDRFWRNADTQDTPGSGLGLAIASDLLETVGGELTVSSAESGGLLVSLLLHDRTRP
ncbi:HAMP domain-containing histidine kinase [Microbacterium sp. KSW4-16]|uniref:sensor histidine kinase n=1 Tax=Microbacterium TaxID=33882 RepID=UPI0010396A70|nr:MULTISPECIES: HAMP domain-containing sensor histidine kinase [Microbacterium]MCK8468051.1 HAMP domain-containing histidine kinase [Microbacterium aurugineum]TCJ23078.1 HAMP domain-containing histidine kinase [Microbacterium sp. PI-1]UUE19446.1 HAMP domain-containing histidine kinase [Microbacterium sp. J1-1]